MEVSSVATRNDRPAVTRERILDGALGLVLTRGLRRTSMAELARQLGVAPSALHYHFPGGKGEILATTFDREEARLLEALETAVGECGDACGRLQALARARMEHLAAVTRLYPVNESMADEVEAWMLERRQRYLGREREIISRVLRDGIARGEVRELDPGLVASAIQGLLLHVTRTFALGPARRSSQTLAELVDMLFCGIGRHS
jgi:AcrR family transcriptional regulator